MDTGEARKRSAAIWLFAAIVAAAVCTWPVSGHAAESESNAPPDPGLIGGGGGSGEEEPPPATCTIEVCCVLTVFEQAWHCFTICISFDEDEKVKGVVSCRGGPRRFLIFRKWAKVKGKNTPPDCFGNPIWGPIDTYCGPYEDGHPDYPTNLKDWEKITCELIVSDSEACEECECIEDVMSCIEECCIDFRPILGPNSNSAAYTALEDCVPSLIVLPDGGPLFGAPGWGQLIDLSQCCPEFP